MSPRGSWILGACALSWGCNSDPSVEVTSQGGVDLCYSERPGARLHEPKLMATTAPDGLAVSLSNIPNMPKPPVFEVKRENDVLRIIGVRPPGAELAAICTRNYQLLIRDLPKGTYEVRAELTVEGGTRIAASTRFAYE